MEAPYGEVIERIGKALIVATGPSVCKVNSWAVGDDVSIIAVNGSISWLDRADFFFSLDPSHAVRGHVANQRGGVKYYMAVPDDYGSERAKVPSHRHAPETDVAYLRRISGDGFKGAKETLSEERDRIHTGNSVYGALGLAYLMGARKVAIVGLDCTRERYAFHHKRPKMGFDHLPDLFRSAVPQLLSRGVSVLNGNNDSPVNCFRKSTPQEAVDWISR